MDPLAHTLFGAALAETGLRRATRYATVSLIVGANLPDLDVLSYVRGADFALGFRRGWTHGLPALVLLPVAWTALIALWSRWRGSTDDVDLRRILGLTSLAVVSHPTLDWLNVYGVRWLMPFDGTWFYGDAVFIVDPWLWLLLAMPVVLARSRGRLALLGWSALATATSVAVTRAPEAPGWALGLWFASLAAVLILRLGPGAAGRTGPAAAPIARLAVILAGVYVLGMLATSRVAETAVADRLRAEPGIGARADLDDPQRITVGPVAFASLRRQVVVSDAEGHRIGSWSPRGVQLEDRVRPRNDDHPAVAPAFAAPCIRGFATWTRLPYWQVDAVPGGGWVATVLDARYVGRFGDDRPSGFGTARVRVTPDGDPDCGQDPR